MKIGILGPLGTFTEFAALKHNSNSEIVPFETISKVFQAVNENLVEEGVVPIENILYGHVLETLDCLKLNEDINIIKSLILPIKQSLVGMQNISLDNSKIEKIISHPQALAQCSIYLDEKFPNAKRESMESTAAAIKFISENKPTKALAIGTSLAAKRYGLNVIEEDISNNKNNKTMFVVISKKESVRTGNDRTSMIINPNLDRPGLLRDILSSFADNEINLEMIQSRPAGEGKYIFYIDVVGHPEEPKLKKAFETIQSKLNSPFKKVIKILGSYPYVSLAE